MDSYSVISSLVEEVSSLFTPDVWCVGITYPARLVENIDSFNQVLSAHLRKSALHFVAKVNQSNACMKWAIEKGCRIEVSSYAELEKAIGFWAQPFNITGSGPKNGLFLDRLIRIWAVISVDSLFELQKIISIARCLNKKTQIILRLSWFRASLPSRFGIDIAYLDECFSVLKQWAEFLEFLWIWFHLDTLWIENRQEIFWECIDQLERFHMQGMIIQIIDIGGWYGSVYQNDITFDTEICLRRKGNKSRLYPEDGEEKWSKFLEIFLGRNNKKDWSISTFLNENCIALWIEPGRSLLTNVGYVVAKVVSQRKSIEGDFLILDTNSFALGMREEEIPTNPYLLGNPEWAKDHHYYLLWNLCLESDYIFSRKVGFTRKVENSDLIIFPDLGAYHMDFYETNSILQPNKSRYFVEKIWNNFSFQKEDSLLNF